MQNRLRHLLKAGLIIVLFGVAEANAQKEITTNGTLTARAIYTDNACLTSTDEEEALEWTGTVIPNIRHEREGARLKTRLNFDVTYNSFADSSIECRSRFQARDRERFTPRLRFKAESILVEDWLFLDARAFADQNKINPFGPGDDELNRTGNTNTTVSYTLSPYLQRRFKDRAALLIRYAFNDQYNSENIVDDSSSDYWTGTLSSGSYFEPINFGLNARYRKVEAADGSDSELQSANIFARYRINRSWEINGRAGDEWNNFSSNFTDDPDDTDGFWWDVGGRWTPNSRVDIGAGYGERFYGTTKRLNARYSHKRSTIRASYTEIITFNRDIRTIEDIGEGDDDTSLRPPTDLPPGFGGEPTTLTNDPILDERFTLSYGLSGQRTSGSVRASHSTQTRAEDGQKSEFSRIGVYLNRGLSSKLSMNTSLEWSWNKADSDSNLFQRDSDTWRYSLGASRSMGQDTNISIIYQYTQRNSDFDLDEYVENRVIFSVSYALF